MIFLSKDLTSGFFENVRLQCTAELAKIVEIYHAQGHAEILVRNLLLAFFFSHGHFSLGLVFGAVKKKYLSKNAPSEGGQ